ncbi:DMT family transporter [Escherichia marmotae]|uniref:DMT family transporter n=1 Tax=Escherichia marmotae TaxID=1499973 RepID=A0ABU1C6N7_9ESCH|nr:DMT family transporter [Escherichia coli]MDQ9215212.1 DMT family transporter [Escherichia marmotae]MDQ9230026.1 DMT family transporter [Escherichia marmotae]MDQ9232750.1 DMT family transporter [Escherichia marmotae]MDQ9237552.1 DMT family transporter [Escherichia marmotae]
MQQVQLRNVNPSLLSDGVLGAFFVFDTTLLALRMGVAAMLSLFIFGRVNMALIMDRFGLLGRSVRVSVSLRLVGIMLVMAGVYCVSLGGK